MMVSIEEIVQKGQSTIRPTYSTRFLAFPTRFITIILHSESFIESNFKFLGMIYSILMKFYRNRHLHIMSTILHVFRKQWIFMTGLGKAAKMRGLHMHHTSILNNRLCRTCIARVERLFCINQSIARSTKTQHYLRNFQQTFLISKYD